MQLAKYFETHRNKKVTVCGIGVSNLPLIRLLCEHHIQVEARDQKTRESLGETGDELEALGVKLVLGPDYLENLDADILYRSPGMMPHMPQLEAAVQRGALLTSEMEAFFEVCPCHTIGITGSDGKTTTSTLIAQMLERDGKRTWLGGNIGTPLLAMVPQMHRDDYAVIELSSFQLMTMRRSPEIAVITNVTPNHLDHHKDMEEYIEAKRAIYLYQPEEGRVVLNMANPTTRSFQKTVRTDVWGFSRTYQPEHTTENFVYHDDGKIYVRQEGAGLKILDVEDIQIPGMHNVENYMAAIAATWGIVSGESITNTAIEFGGVEHRIELVRTLHGVRYFNDSIASSPTRTLAGLNAFEQKVILIAGGFDKLVPFEPLAVDIPEHVKALILLGATKQKIKDAVHAVDPDYNQITEVDTLEQAVQTAQTLAGPGDVVLLSPACASFDMFPNFAVRGEMFKKLVHALR